MASSLGIASHNAKTASDDLSKGDQSPGPVRPMPSARKGIETTRLRWHNTNTAMVSARSISPPRGRQPTSKPTTERRISTHRTSPLCDNLPARKTMALQVTTIRTTTTLQVDIKPTPSTLFQAFQRLGVHSPGRSVSGGLVECNADMARQFSSATTL
jgi:hypothetical protein